MTSLQVRYALVQQKRALKSLREMHRDQGQNLAKAEG